MTLQFTSIRSHSPLQNLPTELLLEITTFLLRVSLMSLSHTNRYSRRSLDCPYHESLRLVTEPRSFITIGHSYRLPELLKQGPWNYWASLTETD